MGNFAIHLDFLEESAKIILTKGVAEKLTPLLKKDFISKTSIALGKGLDFFLLALNAQKQDDRKNRIEGRLICPDSTGLDAEAQWEQNEGGSLKAWWSVLEIDYICQNYGNPKPFKLPLQVTQFPIAWVHFWETHLPDLYLFLKLSTSSAELMKKRLNLYLKANAPAYFNVTVPSETSVNLHISISGDKEEFHTFIEDLVLQMTELHESYPIESLQFGLND